MEVPNEEEKKEEEGNSVKMLFWYSARLYYIVSSGKIKIEIYSFVLKNVKTQEFEHFSCFSVQFFFLLFSLLEKVNTFVLI